MSTKKMMLWATAGVASIVLFGSIFTLVIQSGNLSSEQKLNTALSILDEGRWDIAGRIARDLTNRIDQETNAAWHYVNGVSSIGSIEDQLTTPGSRKVLNNALAHLIKAKEIGFPPGYHGKGNYYLGWCYYHTYRWQDAIQQLQPIPAELPSMRSEALQMVVDSQLSLRPPDYAGAEACLNEWNTIPGMSDSERAKVKLAEAQSAFLKGAFHECESRLVEIGPELPEYFDAMVQRSRWRLAVADQPDAPGRDELLAEVEQILRKVKIMADTPRDLRRQATLLSGKCLVAQNRTIEALSIFNSIRRTEPETAEATVAGIEEAKILMQQADYEGTLATIRAVLRNLEDLSLYNQDWLSIDGLTSELLGIGTTLRDRGEFQDAIRLADHLAIAFPLANSLRLKSDVYERWADKLNQTTDGDEARPLIDQSNLSQYYLAAAEGFEQLSKLQLRTPEYTSILWRSIENYQRANALDKANELLQLYIRFEERTKLPRGLLAIGKNRMSTGQWSEALQPLEKCMLEYEDHPVSFEARLMAAQAKSELNELDEAIELLEANTRLYQLRPENQVWRDSLFELGQLVFRQGDQLLLDLRLNPNSDWNDRKAKLEKSQEMFTSAVERLGEAFSRWPNDPRHYDARYYHARALRLAAEMPAQTIAANPDLVNSARRKFLQQKRDLLEKALQNFRALHQSINKTQDAIQSQEQVVSLLRNSYFGEADVLYDLERWEDAIQAYRNVTARFLNQPESLEALLQIAHCYRKLGKELEATQVLNTAAQVLVRIPAEADSRFAAVTRGSRKDWARMIDLMQR